MPSKDEIDLAILRNNVVRLLAERRMSKAELSTAVGKSKNWAASWLRTGSQTEPGAIAVRRCAEVLGVSGDDLHAEAQHNPVSDGTMARATGALQSVRKLVEHSNATQAEAFDLLNRERAIEFLDLWVETGGVIDSRFEQLTPYFDVFTAPEEGKSLEVLHMGVRSLAAAVLEDTDKGAYNAFIREELSPEDQADLNQSLRIAVERGTGSVGARRRTVPLGDGVYKDVRFARMHFPCTLVSQGGARRTVIANVAHLVTRHYADAPTPYLAVHQAPQSSGLDLGR